MTTSLDFKNGASLENCHTNFFALADLNGIKWRKFSTDIVSVDVLEDPVLLSYSKCIAAGILAVWRRIITQKHIIHQTPQEINSLCCNKELWIFWYEEEPDLSGLISSNLTEIEQGSWESGLSYECRTLLFKALHNLIERCLLSQGYTRLGKFFIEPQNLTCSKKKNQIAFGFHFFLHGESTVCASIDARLTSSIYSLSKCHITAAQTQHKGVKVILSPYGMEGKLTGVGYKYSDTNMANLLNSWHQFYPYPVRKDKMKMDNDLPNVVEVITAGTRMKYPTAYVFVTDEDHSEAIQNSAGPTVSARVQPLKLNHIPATGLLTPPMSPSENLSFNENSKLSKDILVSIANSENEEKMKRKHMYNTPECIKHSICQECYLPIVSEKAEENSVLWDFHDQFIAAKCMCSRKHFKRKKFRDFSRMDEADASESLHHGFASSTNLKNLKRDKAHSSFYGVPFHRQKDLSQYTEDNFQSECSSVLKNASVKSVIKDFKSCSSDSNMTMIPQLQCKSESQQVAFMEMQYSQLSSFDPAMPTLSPQPPVVKEECHSLDTHCQVNISSPVVNSPHCVTLKGKLCDEILSPFYKSLLNTFENAKSVKKTSVSLNSESDLAGNVDSMICDTSVPDIKAFEKPQLPKQSREDDNVQLAMSGLLYDYRHFSSSLWDPPPSKKYCSPASFTADVYDEGSDDSGSEFARNTYELFHKVPSVPKDPYEFTEFDEAVPSERAFRQKELYPKEDDKHLASHMPSPLNVPSPTVSVAPAQPQEALISQNDEYAKTPSPPGNKIFCSKFIREEDLAVSFHDLDNIFDTSSEEEDNVEIPVTTSKLSTIDELSGKLELSRMYPTPPSLEQNAVPSPFGIFTGTDNASVENDVVKEDEPVNNLSFLKEDVCVWKPPTISMFVESPKYAPLNKLSFHNCTSSLELIYQSSSVSSSRISHKICEDPVLYEKQIFSQSSQYAIFDDEQLCHNFYPASCEAVSPASSHPSYPNSFSFDASVSELSLEVDSLIVNLLLSDSMLNLFKDHNFACCCICVCNMNIKGADAGVILPNTLIPTGNDEPQYKCTCGFSAVVHRHRSFNAGLFYEDEFEISGYNCDISASLSQSTGELTIKRQTNDSDKGPLLNSDHIPAFLLDMLKIQCKNISSAFSLFYKSGVLCTGESESTVNEIEIFDGCEVCFIALEQARNITDNSMPTKLDESLKFTCLHKWPYISSPLPSTNQDLMLHLDSLKPLLQVAIHRKNPQRLWDITYVVTGPLTWREFHRLAARGSEDQCEPLPIPSVLMGHDSDYITLSPFALRYWDKLLLEPYSLPRDVAYIVVAPENDVVLSHIKTFFRELSSTYELHNLGKHCPITKVLRDGIMRVGKTAASKVAEEPLSEWFNSIGDSPTANKIKLYARVCKHRLAPHLSTLSLDRSIFESTTSSKSSERPSGNLSSAQLSGDNEKPATPKQSENDTNGELHVESSACSQDSADDDYRHLPALVIYIVEPFTFAQYDSNLYRLVTLGLLHSYADMLPDLPEATRNSMHLQLLSLDAIMCFGSSSGQRKDEIKTLALSVFSQSHHLVTHQSSVKSLTGFGPAAAEKAFLNSKKDKMQQPMKMYNRPFILASVKDKQAELGEMFGDRRENSGVLYCSYCLTKDKRFILACCTNDKGEFTETNVININIPNRNKRKQTSVRKFGLRKLLDFILEVISASSHPWRLIIARFGRLGHGELKAWASLLSRKSLQSYARHLKELCGECAISGIADTPSILSVCLISLEPDSSLRLMSDQFTLDDHFSNTRQQMYSRTTPDNSTYTHILVFPTSATTQSSQATFPSEDIDPLPGGLDEGLFEGLNDNDITGPDINDIFKWTESPQSPEGSSHRDSNSQPPSPSTSFRLSSSNHGGPNRCDSMSENTDEPLQLLQQPLALGYFVSTAKTGLLPKWFWSSCPHLGDKSPVFLKSALLIHLPFVQQNSDDLLHHNSQQQSTCHPLDSNYTSDVLRFVLEGYNALSWLVLDPKYHDRRSCLPLHIQILMQLYNMVEAIL